jgi:CRP-like cAMP-binding protein
MEMYIYFTGDLGDAWHILLSGKIHILVSKGFDSQTHLHISTLSNAGEAFGSHSLVHDSPRTSTAVCASSHVLLLRMERVDYKRLLGFLNVMEQKELIHFLRLRCQSVFSRLKMSELAVVAEKIELKNFKVNSIIIREGEQRDHMFIVKRGVCAVSLLQRWSRIIHYLGYASTKLYKI